MTWRVLVIALTSAAMGAGCSLALDLDQVQCEVNADCDARGAAGFQCIDAVCVEPEQQEDPRLACRTTPWPPLAETPVQVLVRALALQVEQPVPGLTVRACDTLLDPSCNTPRDTATTDTSGIARLQVADGFRGHFFVAPTEGLNAPYILHMFPPPDSGVVETQQGRLTITNLETMAQIATVAGEAVVPGRGHFFFTVLDCNFQPLGGVVVSVSDLPGDGLVAYLGANGLPDQALPRTSASGLGVAINLPPGFVTVRADHNGVQLFEQVILIAADTVTSSQVVPSVF